MYKTRILALSIAFVLVFSITPRTTEAQANTDTPPPPSTSKTAPLTEEELKNALVIDNINNRSALVPPGGSQLYRLQGTVIYIKVLAEELIDSSQDSEASTKGATYTQVCGIDVYKSGLLMAYLRNRANVYYYTGYTLAPARFNWMDMYGTRSVSIFATWKSLGQFSYPSIMQRFETYGYTQAWGNLEIKFYPWGGETYYFVSRLVVNTSGTYCQ